MLSPHVDLVEEKGSVNMLSVETETFTCSFDNNGKIENVTPIQPNNEIWYTSSDGNIVEPMDSETWEPIPVGSGVTTFGVNIVSNTYVDGKGIIKFDGNVTSIGNYVFYDCTSLTSCIIPNSVTSIGNNAFYYCTSLTSCIIPNSVTSIGDYAFYGCSSLTGITIPNSVTSIGSAAFRDCSSLSEVICNPTTPPTLGSYTFYNNASGRKIKVPSGSVNAYKGATNWKTYASDIISQ